MTSLNTTLNSATIMDLETESEQSLHSESEQSKESEYDSESEQMVASKHVLNQSTHLEFNFENSMDSQLEMVAYNSLQSNIFMAGRCDPEKLLLSENLTRHLKKYYDINEDGTVSFAGYQIETENPSTPTRLHFTKCHSDEVTLQWSPPDRDGGLSIVSYIIEASIEQRKWQHVATTEKTIYSCKVRDHYKTNFRISASNGIFKGQLIEIRGTPSMPTAPTISKCGYGWLLKWSPPITNEVIVNYFVERSFDGKTWEKIEETEKTNCTVKVLSERKTYFRIAGTNGTNHGEFNYVDAIDKGKTFLVFIRGLTRLESIQANSDTLVEDLRLVVGGGLPDTDFRILYGNRFISTGSLLDNNIHDEAFLTTIFALRGGGDGSRHFCNRRMIKTSIFNFTCQTALEYSHQFFDLSFGTVLLTFDGQKNLSDFDDGSSGSDVNSLGFDLKKWIDTIMSCCVECGRQLPEIYFVATHMAEDNIEERRANLIRQLEYFFSGHHYREHLNIESLFCIGYESDIEFIRLTQLVTDLLMVKLQLKNFKFFVLDNQLLYLRSKGVFIVNYTDIKRKNNMNGLFRLDDSELKDFLSEQQAVGSILLFDSENAIVINPETFVNIIERLFTDLGLYSASRKGDGTGKYKGLISRSDLLHMLDRFEFYMFSKHDFILFLLRMNLLVSIPCPKRNTECFLIPGVAHIDFDDSYSAKYLILRHSICMKYILKPNILPIDIFCRIITVAVRSWSIKVYNGNPIISSNSATFETNNVESFTIQFDNGSISVFFTNELSVLMIEAKSVQKVHCQLTMLINNIMNSRRRTLEPSVDKSDVLIDEVPGMPCHNNRCYFSKGSFPFSAHYWQCDHGIIHDVRYLLYWNSKDIGPKNRLTLLSNDSFKTRSMSMSYSTKFSQRSISKRLYEMYKLDIQFDGYIFDIETDTRLDIRNRRIVFCQHEYSHECSELSHICVWNFDFKLSEFEQIYAKQKYLHYSQRGVYDEIIQCIETGKDLLCRYLLKLGLLPLDLKNLLNIAMTRQQQAISKAISWYLVKAFIKEHKLSNNLRCLTDIWPGYMCHCMSTCDKEHKHICSREIQIVCEVANIEATVSLSQKFVGIDIKYINSYTNKASMLKSKSSNMHIQYNTKNHISGTVARYLFNKHSKLTAVFTSPDQPGYVQLYCSVKGIIPMGEEHFPTKLLGLRTKIDEGSVNFLSNLLVGDTIQSGTLGGFVRYFGMTTCLTCAHVVHDRKNLLAGCKAGKHDQLTKIHCTRHNNTFECGEVINSCFEYDNPHETSVDAALIRLSGNIGVDVNNIVKDGAGRIQPAAFIGMKNEFLNDCYVNHNSNVGDVIVRSVGSVSGYYEGEANISDIDADEERFRDRERGVQVDWESLSQRLGSIQTEMPKSLYVPTDVHFQRVILRAFEEKEKHDRRSVRFYNQLLVSNVPFRPGDSGTCIYVVGYKSGSTGPTGCLGMAVASIETAQGFKCIVTPMKAILKKIGII